MSTDQLVVVELCFYAVVFLLIAYLATVAYVICALDIGIHCGCQRLVKFVFSCLHNGGIFSMNEQLQKVHRKNERFDDAERRMTSWSLASDTSDIVTSHAVLDHVYQRPIGTHFVRVDKLLQVYNVAKCSMSGI